VGFITVVDDVLEGVEVVVLGVADGVDDRTGALPDPVEDVVAEE
jgi:hypothetical protein